MRLDFSLPISFTGLSLPLTLFTTHSSSNSALCEAPQVRVRGSLQIERFGRRLSTLRLLTCSPLYFSSFRKTIGLRVQSTRKTQVLQKSQWCCHDEDHASSSRLGRAVGILQSSNPARQTGFTYIPVRDRLRPDAHLGAIPSRLFLKLLTLPTGPLQHAFL